MEQVKLQHIEVINNRIEYQYSVSDGLKSYFFLNVPYSIEYMADGVPLDLHDVPPSVLAVPFVCNVLPMIWLTDSELIVPDLDRDFWESCLPIRQAYEDLYPDAVFGGKISAGHLTKNTPVSQGRRAVFFSGGIDSWCTLLRHVDESPDLISLWGSDIRYDNVEGWNCLYKQLHSSVQDLHLPHIVIRTAFRCVINEGALYQAFSKQLHDGWWHGIQHSIAIISHSAPCNYLRGVTMQYFAASFFPSSKVIGASYPTIDNQMYCCSSRTVHDSYITRLQKIHRIINYQKSHQYTPSIHVCWESPKGSNCCHCEKCYRTIMGFLVAEELPYDYGFPVEDVDLAALHHFMVLYWSNHEGRHHWKQLQSAFIENKSMLRTKPYYKDIKWIETFDFDHPERYWKRRLKRAVGYPRIFARKVKGKLKHILNN